MANTLSKISLPQCFKQLQFPSRQGKWNDKAQNKHATIKLYDRDNLHDCPWPQTEEGQQAKSFLTPLIHSGVHHFIENVQTDLRVLVADEIVLPISINNAEYENSYVCSPYSYYISYAKESLELLTQKWAYHAINALLCGLSKILKRYQVNKVVFVNNWLFSTSLYPEITPEQLENIAQFLIQQFPDHAIVFRSVDPSTNPTCYQTLYPMGFDYIASRQIFYIHPKKTTLFESRLFKSDLKLLKNCGYEMIGNEQLTSQDIPRLQKLYSDLFITKYSDLNPQFNERFIHLAWKDNLMRFKALQREGRIDGVVGYVERNGTMFCPLFGYDRTLPKEVALYRLLSTVLMLEADRQNLLFHQSSGASMYKQIRKAHNCIEYLAVYYRHLNLKRQLPWFCLKNMCNSLGIMYMKRY